MDYSVKGHRALVTGSSRGIGSAIALELAKGGDLRITNALLYQLSHGSAFKKCCCISQQQMTCPGIEPGFTP